jgi:hypothetical protein
MNRHHMTAEGMIPFTPEEEAEMDAMEATHIATRFNATIDAQIAALEAKLTQRRLREAVISGDNSFIADIDAQITTLRAQRL